MTADRGPVLMLDPFVLVFEGRTVDYGEWWRSRECPHCYYRQLVEYGRNMPADTHLCYRDNVKHIVVWKTL